MPIQRARFARVINGALKDRVRARVLGGHFIDHFARYCQEELERIGLLPGLLEGGKQQQFSYHLKRYVIGGSYTKEVDVVFESNTSGPLLAISLKAPNSSILGNVNSRLEEMAGEAGNLHSRFPMLVLGHVTVLPYVDPKSGQVLLDPRGLPSPACRRLANKLYGISGRGDPTSTQSTFEEVGVVFVKYGRKRASACTSYPPRGIVGKRSIRLDTFFDRMLERLRERNPLLFPDL
jgi:hypothetical protein